MAARIGTTAAAGSSKATNGSQYVNPSNI